MASNGSIFKSYHSSFQGETYDACAKCGGKCEKYKISALMPDEEYFMAEALGYTVEEFKQLFLTEINTPFGDIYVLKMVGICPFLNSEFRCTAGYVKPVLCDSYPIVFRKIKDEIIFYLDQNGCPMVQWSEYRGVIDQFKNKGIPALKKLRISMRWWEMVLSFDEFDFDYSKIEHDLKTHTRQEPLILEEILGYACNGFERKARIRGLLLVKKRLDKVSQEYIKGFSYILNSVKLPPIRLLVNTCQKSLINRKKMITDTILKGRIDEKLLSPSDSMEYEKLIGKVISDIQLLKDEANRLTNRIYQLIKTDHIESSKDKNAPNWLDLFQKSMALNQLKENNEFTLHEITHEGSNDFWHAYTLLSEAFSTDELDSVVSYLGVIKETRLHGWKRKTLSENGVKKSIWARWIMVVLKDNSKKIVGVADGAIILNEQLNTFYVSHIAIKSSQRSKQLGTLLSHMVFKVAESHLKLHMYSKNKKNDSNHSHTLLTEIGEIDFLEDSNPGSIPNRRAIFHGRLGRSAIWPIRFAQMDTDYNFTQFDENKWNSVPLFISFRAFSQQTNNIETALMALDLLLDYFILFCNRYAVWDKTYLHKYLFKDDFPYLIPFPDSKTSLPGFILKTGFKNEILNKYYPNHYYTRHRHKFQTYSL